MLDNQTPEWWKAAVVYQIYPRSFADSNGDGIGDIRGAVSKLDYLAELGVDVVWLSPFFASPQDDNGYDVSDYEAVDPIFGTLEDLDALIEGLHERGMYFVMDLVVNHTSDEHPWFVESRSSLDNPKRDWYWWRPGAPGQPPTNWKSYFSGPAWEYDPSTAEHYLHLFTRKQPDLNWENPEVRQAIYAMMRRWIARGVDGFRMDVINMISKRVGPDGALADGGAGAASAGFGGDQYLNGPRVHEFLAEMNAAVLAPAQAGKVLLTVGETPGTTVDEAALYSGPLRDELAMVFTFEHMDLDADGSKWNLTPLFLPDLKANLEQWQDGLNGRGWNSLYWDNHDQPRIVSRWGDVGDRRVASAKAWATALHLLQGTPYIYQGEELGMTNTEFTAIDDYADVESLNWAREALAQGRSEADIVAALAVKSRDHARTPMQWDSSQHAGFTTGQPWLPVTANYPDINAAAALDDPNSVFAHYRHLIALRHTHDVIVHGNFDLLLPDHEQLFAYRRQLNHQVLLVVINLSPTGASFEGEVPTGQLLVGPEDLVSRVSRTGVQLGAWEHFAMLCTSEGEAGKL